MSAQSDRGDCTASASDDFVQRNREWLVRLILSLIGSQAIVKGQYAPTGISFSLRVVWVEHSLHAGVRITRFFPSSRACRNRREFTLVGRKSCKHP
jgi:hypothetical protein